MAMMCGGSGAGGLQGLAGLGLEDGEEVGNPEEFVEFGLLGGGELGLACSVGEVVEAVLLRAGEAESRIDSAVSGERLRASRSESCSSIAVAMGSGRSMLVWVDMGVRGVRGLEESLRRLYHGREGEGREGVGRPSDIKNDPFPDLTPFPDRLRWSSWW